MYTEKQIDELIQPLVKYYSDLQSDLIADICVRLTPDELSGTAEWRLQKLSEIGALNNANIKHIAEVTKITEERIQELIEDVGLKAIADDDKLYTKAFGELPPISKSTLEVLVFAREQAREFQNLVGTRALQSANNAFIQIVEKTFLQVSTGEFDYTSAIRSAVKELSDTGINGITYISDTGRITRWNVDTAVRQMLLDTTSRTSAEMQLDRAEQVGAELVEVSSHTGERPSHAIWSGKVYQLKGSGKYPNFKESTHYGERSARALLGYNCRHTFFPFIEGISTRTFHPQPKAENERIYNLRTQQRYNERQIRRYKRREQALKALNDEEGARQARLKLREWQAIQRELLAKNPILKRDYARERI